jgi:hypothetical protein
VCTSQGARLPEKDELEAWIDTGESKPAGTVYGVTASMLEIPLKIFAAGHQSCALRRDFLGVKCWGWDRKRSIEISETLADRKIVDLATCGGGMCALIDGETGVSCWGGDDSSASQQSQRLLTGDQFSSIDYMWDRACGIKEGGGIKCWSGMGITSQAGTFGTVVNPAGADSDYHNKKFSQMCVGGHYGSFYVCATLKDETRFKCWGSNAVVSGAGARSSKDFTRIACGANHFCGIVKDQVGLECWGADKPNEGEPNNYNPVAGASEYSTYEFTEIAAGQHHMCGIVKDRKGVKCWGWNGHHAKTSTDAERMADFEFASLTAGSQHTCGVTKYPDFGIKCWGSNGHYESESPTDEGYPQGLQLTTDPTSSYYMCVKDPAAPTTSPTAAPTTAAAPTAALTAPCDPDEDPCCVRGWPNTAGVWESGLWSPPMAVSLFARTPDYEEYQVPPPSCPKKCDRRSVDDTSDTTSTGWENPLKIALGGDQSCVLRKDFLGVECWGWDKKNTLMIAKTFNQTKVTDVATNGAGMCALIDGEAGVSCWGGDHESARSVDTALEDRRLQFTDEFTSIDYQYYVACGTMKNGGIKCWTPMGFYGGFGNEINTYESNKEFSQMCVGGHHPYYVCGMYKENGHVKCWGNTGIAPPTDIEFSRIACGLEHFCAIHKSQGRVQCWGSDTDLKNPDGSRGNPQSGASAYSAYEFTEIASGTAHVCGIVKDQLGVKCWGWKGYSGLVTTFPDKLAHFEFASLAAGHEHTCGVTKAPILAIKCWGSNANYQVEGPGDNPAPQSIKLVKDSTCKTEHHDKSGPRACTSCFDSRTSLGDDCVNGERCHLTILDPRTNTGTCTNTACPACKPSACCGPHHKHFVVNTESLTGVCVRHTDDCTPVCMPRGDNEPDKTRVCSKGCNQLLKVDKDFEGSAPPVTTDESLLYDMVVCQADKRVICDPSATNATSCSTHSSVKAVARCNFQADAWDLGGTCIASYIHNLPGSACALCSDANDSPESAGNECPVLVNAQCSMPQASDHAQCKRLAISY